MCFFLSVCLSVCPHRHLCRILIFLWFILFTNYFSIIDFLIFNNFRYSLLGLRQVSAVRDICWYGEIFFLHHHPCKNTIVHFIIHISVWLICTINHHHQFSGGGGLGHCHPALVGEQHILAQACSQGSGYIWIMWSWVVVDDMRHTFKQCSGFKSLQQILQDVEWGFCFDVHLNAFFPILVILHFLQLFVYHTLIGEIPTSQNSFESWINDFVSESDWFLSTLLGNSMWLVCLPWNINLTFLLDEYPALQSVNPQNTLMPAIQGGTGLLHLHHLPWL